MKKFLLAGLCLFFSSSGLLLAQNKTLGVGVAAPNANAALHVESPTNNQGFIMPRLTTAQREAMSSLLTLSDKGLMLYDTDRNAMFIWDGALWKSSSEFALTDTTSTTSVISVLNKGLGNAGKFQNQNRSSKTPALWAESNSDSALSAPIYGLNTGTGDVAGSFKQANAATKFPALYGESLGTGGVARFINNGTGGTAVFSQVNKTGHAYWAQHEGTAGYAAILQSVNAANPSPAVFVEAVGTGFSLFVQKSLPESTGDAVYSEHLGASGHAGRFVINNALNPSVGLLSSTNGSGAAIFAENTGPADGFAGSFATTDPANTFPAIQASTQGSGSGVRVIQSTGPGAGMDVYMQNTTSTATGLIVDHNGLGTSGSFAINNATSNASSLYVGSNGLGDGGFFQLDNASSTNTAVKGRAVNTGGGAGAFEIFNANNSNSALNAYTDGTGTAGNFTINNTANPGSALYATTNGTGSAIGAQTATGWTAFHAKRDGINGNAAMIEISDPANSYPALQANTAGTGFAINARHTGTAGDAIYAEHAGAGSGSAGNFRISNAENTASSLFAATNAPGGVAMSASNEANGLAFAVWGGGMKVSTHTLSADGSITTRASAYLITGGTSYTLGFTMNEGEIVYFFNSTATAVPVDALLIPANGGKTCIFLGGALRAL